MVVWTILVVVFLGASVKAWDCTASMVIAEIAKRQLDRGVKSKIDDFTDWLSQTGPFPKVPDMDQSACWPDDLLENNGIFEQWHHMYDPYSPDGSPTEGCPYQRTDLVSVVINTGEAMSPYKYGNTWQMAFALASYLHFFGDLHHPLHNVELFTSQIPNGDKGGKEFNVKFNGKLTNLHDFWDSVCGTYTPYDRPLNLSGKFRIDSLARQLISKYGPTFSNATKHVWQAYTMHKESWAIARAVAYSNVTLGQELSAEYIASCVSTAEQRIALAGFRLGNQLNHVFARYTSAPQRYPREHN